MKACPFDLRSAGFALGIGLALVLGGCGNAAQQAAFDQAAKAEQHLTAENAATVIADYRQAIALQPDSALAGKARKRIDALEARLNAEEQRKSVFQEHGVD